MNEAALALRRRYCETHPDVCLYLASAELLELIDEREEALRKLAALREHLERRHGCRGDCWGVGG